MAAFDGRRLVTCWIWLTQERPGVMLMLKLESHNPFMQEHSTLACGVSVCSSQLRRRWQKLMRCRCVILV